MQHSNDRIQRHGVSAVWKLAFFAGAEGACQSRGLLATVINSGRFSVRESHMQKLTNRDQLLQERPYPKLLSLVFPMYNEESAVPHLREALSEFMAELQCETEVILVNDGSTDATLTQITAWAREDPRIRVISLSRNFGHQNASTAGLDYSSGDAIVLLDADLQDPVSVIHQMIERYREGYDVVYGQRVTRQIGRAHV